MKTMTDAERVAKYLRQYERLETRIARELKTLMDKDAVHPLVNMVDFTSEGIRDLGFLSIEYGHMPVMSLYKRYLKDLQRANEISEKV